MESELPKSTVYFDGSCPLCRAEIGYYRRKDQAGALCFVDVSEAPPQLRKELPNSERWNVSMFAQAMGVFSPERRRLSRFGLVYPNGAGRRAPHRCRERWLPWSWATGCFFRSGRSSPASLGGSCSFRRSSTEQSAGD